MTDLELQDAIGDLHVLGRVDALWNLSTHDFVRDWRVAGIVLQKWPTIINTEHLDMTLDEMLRNPRAIIEAGVEALKK